MTTTPYLAIDVVDTHGTVLVRVAGELDILTVPELAATLAPLRSQQCELDLAQVPFVDSTVLNLLLRHRQHALVEAGSLQVVAVSSPLQRLLDITGTARLLIAHPDPDQPGATPPWPH